MKEVWVHGRVIEIWDANHQLTMRMNISTNELDFRENILIFYDRPGSEPRLSDGDVVDVRGIFHGVITYTSGFGDQIAIPAIAAEEVIRQEAA